MAERDVVAFNEANAEEAQLREELEILIKPLINEIRKTSLKRWIALGFDEAEYKERPRFIIICQSCGSLSVGMGSVSRRIPFTDEVEYNTSLRCDSCKAREEY